MRKKLVCGLLSLGLLLGSAQGAEGGFSDVKSTDWFAPYVSVCVENGLMKGTGGGNFSPSLLLTEAECSTMALRLFMLPRGGDGTFETAPEGAGLLSLALADGTVLSGYSGEENPFDGWSFGGATEIPVKLPGETEEEKEAWGKAHEGPATFSANGKSWPGETRCWINPNGQWEMIFTANEENGVREDLSSAIRQGLLFTSIPGPDKWWRDAAYTAQLWEVEGLTFSARNADRAFFVQALSAAAGELEPINAITSLPDTQDPQVLAFYNAGILTGVDKAGTFAGSGTLSRSEAAAMMARIVEPSLRQSFAPQGEPEPTPGGDLGSETAMVVNGQKVSAQELASWVVQLAYYWDSYSYSTFGSRLTWDAELEENILTQAKMQSVAYVTMAAKAQGLGCTVGQLAVTLTPSPTREELEAYVKKADLLRAKHILVADKVTAESIITSLNAQPTMEQFDNILGLLGTDPGMASNPSGYLFTAGEMVEEFEAGTRALPVGAYSPEPVQSSFGFHVILRLDPLEHPDLKGLYQEEVLNDLVDQWVKEASVQVNEEVVAQIDVQATYNAYLQSLAAQQ